MENLCKMCTRCAPSKKIEKQEAVSLICEAVDRMLENGDLSIDEDCEDPCVDIDSLVEKAIEFFNENGYFYCGDFAVIESEEWPTRANIYGYTSPILWL